MVSDSNVRVGPDYLRGIAAAFGDERVDLARQRLRVLAGTLLQRVPVTSGATHVAPEETLRAA